MFGHIDPLGAEEPQIGDGDREAHAPLRARLQQDLLEALQLADRARAAGHGITDVELDDLLAGDGAGVAHRDGRIEPVALAAQRRLVKLERAVFERAVSETVPERIERRVRAFETAGGGELAEHVAPLPVDLVIAANVDADLVDRKSTRLNSSPS